jgi:type 1 fimbria pilin
MKKNLNLLMIAVAAASALVATSPAQAQSVTLGVTGTLKPTSCLPTLNGGGTLDWGDISTSSILPDAPNKLDHKQIRLSVECQAKTAVAIKIVDNRSGSAVPGISVNNSGASIADQYVFGLGSVGGKNIGAYHVALVATTFTGDGEAVTTMHRQGSSTGVWDALAPTIRALMSPTQVYTWGAVGATVPDAFQVVTGDLSVTPVLNKGSELPREGDITLDGSLSIELAYL